ncbi:hypothetical protein GUITHDRAFT_165955 [Guillardia theta CCMP2712]|uniref:HTH CENPB-type domain-containing protein n=1 Tax=Guillardia theta (strain CCMP2712) TaxID=905079 RepID=L1IGX4_GUITC|nr:hypothetical protein GUITHDRAFT_165955 [Guillardia theta CCMP2712]EKX35511.1 hypothetical protein GUITHDRAFT_165955 [Guillardia theta CCMP2712]|eukprot:XP_005822491.1 hypothetical protein GUITHDRAFT_165955 [Guillardia theta CCMP2712]
MHSTGTLFADALDARDPDFDLLKDVFPLEAEFERCLCPCCCAIPMQSLDIVEDQGDFILNDSCSQPFHGLLQQELDRDMEEEGIVQDEQETSDENESSSQPCAEMKSKQYKEIAEMKKGRSWTENQKKKHKSACKGKRRLTLAQKLEIVRMQESSSPGDKKTQAQIAEMYGKCRSAISKILHPRNIAKIKKSLNIGVDLTIRRCSAVTEFEKRFLESLGEEDRRILMSGMPCNDEKLCVRANLLAKEMGTVGFEANPGWLSRFVKRHLAAMRV